jgi:gas vesicle protein
MKKNTERLLEGAALGAILGVAAGMMIPSSTKSKKSLQNISGDFYKYLAPRVKKMKNMSEAQYDAFITAGVKNYAKLKKLSAAEQKALLTEAKRSWKQIKKHLK